MFCVHISPPVVVHYESECVVRQVVENGEGAVYVVGGSGGGRVLSCIHKIF